MQCMTYTHMYQGSAKSGLCMTQYLTLVCNVDGQFREVVTGGGADYKRLHILVRDAVHIECQGAHSGAHHAIPAPHGTRNKCCMLAAGRCAGTAYGGMPAPCRMHLQRHLARQGWLCNSHSLHPEEGGEQDDMSSHNAQQLALQWVLCSCLHTSGLHL